MDLTRSPLLGVLLEQRPAAVGVDIEAVGDVAADAVEESHRVALPGELAGLLRTARVLPPPRSVPPVRDACRCSPSALPTPNRAVPSPQ